MSAMRGNRKGVSIRVVSLPAVETCESKVTLPYLGKIKTSTIGYHRVERVGKLFLLAIAGDGIGTSWHGDGGRPDQSHEQQQPQETHSPAQQTHLLVQPIAFRAKRTGRQRSS